MRVACYWNFHKKCFSVKALEGEQKGRVIDHCDEVYLTDVQFKVSEAGRQRVLREKRKNVHAWVIGNLQHSVRQDAPYSSTLYASAIGAPTAWYNPYNQATFTTWDGQNNRPVTIGNADRAALLVEHFEDGKPGYGLIRLVPSKIVPVPYENLSTRRRWDGEGKLTKVIVKDTVKQYVDTGWVEEGPASWADYDRYPVAI